MPTWPSAAFDSDKDSDLIPNSMLLPLIKPEVSVAWAVVLIVATLPATATSTSAFASWLSKVVSTTVNFLVAAETTWPLAS